MPGVPMAEVIAVPGSAGAAVGLALQGALNNLAGGILLMILHDGNFRESRPKISAAGKEKPGPGEKRVSVQNNNLSGDNPEACRTDTVTRLTDEFKTAGKSRV